MGDIMTVADLKLGTRINNALNNFYTQHGKSIDTVQVKELARWQPEAFFRLKALGRDSVDKIINALDEAGFPYTKKYELVKVQRSLCTLLGATEVNRKVLKGLIVEVDRIVSELQKEEDRIRYE